ncbi:hypothetical protein OXPF_16720 [Oxobacter pfennigii]|uniref:DUF116 domain-containing protein n=1 Tax=Oxobacter pfennigii TaxID=36849 RepID=A0A0P8WA45_9CLOT|nr:DUF116 domain-containing protein [Oxobacter pfennigii]KPU44589.1 hypothetical protein OXPF_16720 [Oxobacter pfennigii]
MKTKENILVLGLRSYVSLAFMVFLFFAFIASILTALSKSIDRLLVNIILNIFALMMTGAALLLIASVIYALYIYNKSIINQKLLYPLSSSFKMLLNIIVALSMFLKYNKDSIRHFYIHMNNIIVRSCNRKFAPQNILLLLPHCIQNSECKYRVTNHIENCRKCGSCVIKSIVELKERTGIKVEVATGGTSALNAVQNNKPELVIAVACERDLTGGISEVRGIPVLGVLNDRPYGPCKNTSVDIGMIQKYLHDFTDYDKTSV